MRNSHLIEVANRHADPENGFIMDPEDVVKYADKAVGIWHTHPNETANLSGADWESFLSWGEDYLFAIVGTDGVRWYRVEGAGVVNEPLPESRRRGRARA